MSVSKALQGTERTPLAKEFIVGRIAPQKCKGYLQPRYGIFRAVENAVRSRAFIQFQACAHQVH